jgi:hypothetical protein
MLFAVLFLFLLLVSGACSFSLSSFLKKEVPLDTQRVCAALYKLPKVPDNNLFREARLLAESSAVCRKSHFWVWERMNPMEIADLIATDLRVQDFIGRVREEHARVEKEREKAYAEKRDLKMVQLYKRRHQQRFKCIAAALWTHDSRSQSLPTLQKNPLPDMPERISSWMKPVRISFERNDSHQVDSLPRWCVLVYITYVLLGLKKFGLFPNIMTIVRSLIYLFIHLFQLAVRSLMSIRLREKSNHLLEHIIVFFQEATELVRSLILILIRLTMFFCAQLLATASRALLIIIDEMEFNEAAILALYFLFIMFSFALMCDPDNVFVGHAWYLLGNLTAGYIWMEYVMKSYWGLADFWKTKSQRKEKAKKPRISSSPLKKYWICVLIDLEKAARLMASRHLDLVITEFKRMCYVTLFIPVFGSTLFTTVIPSRVADFCYGGRFAVNAAFFVLFVLIREAAIDRTERVKKTFNIGRMN